MAEGFRHTESLNRTAGARTAKQVRCIFFTTSHESDEYRTAAEKAGLTYSEWTRRALRAAVMAQGADRGKLEPFLSIEERAKARDQKVGAGVLTGKLAKLKASLEICDWETATAQTDELIQTVRGR